MSRPECVNSTNSTSAFEKRMKEVLSLEANRERIGDLAYNNFKKFYGCSQSMMQAFQSVLGFEDALWFKAVGGLQGGGCCGLTCGALVMGFILIGTRAGRQNIEEGFRGILPAMEPCQRLGKWFKLQYRSTICSEISGHDWFDIEEVIAHYSTPKGRDTIEKCARLTGGTAYEVAEILSGMCCP